jgi:hypothetical protein
VSDDSISAQFVINTVDDANRLTAFLRQHAGACVESGNPLRVLVQQDEDDAFNYQVRYYWGITLKSICEQAWIDGKQFDKDTWHEFCCGCFLPKKEIVMPDGEIVIRRHSIARGHISAKKMAKYTIEVEAWASSELGVIFPEKQNGQ